MSKRATRADAVCVIDLWYTTERNARSIADSVGISKNAVVRIVKGQLFADVIRPIKLPDWRY